MYVPVASRQVSWWLGRESGSQQAVSQGKALGWNALVFFM